MPMSWITDGTIWMKVMDRQDHSLSTVAVPQAMQETTTGSRVSLWVQFENEFFYLFGIHTQSTQIPQAVVNGGNWTTVLRVADLGKE
jgi:hypothetical protein